MITDTSLEAYMELKGSREYKSKMMEVYEAIRKVPLMTGREYTTLILKKLDMNEVRPRITDLKDLGLVCVVGKRLCTISKKKAYIWSIKQLPKTI